MRWRTFANRSAPTFRKSRAASASTGASAASSAAGPGYGGSCFPKDTLALVRTAQSVGAPTKIVEAVVEINDRRKRAMAERIVAACGGDVAGKTVAILGLTFKRNGRYARCAVLDIIPALQAAGATIRAFDPAGAHEPSKHFRRRAVLRRPYHALEGADAVALINRMGRVPRPRPRPHEVAAEGAGHGRPPKRLPPGADGRPRIRIPLDRPAVGSQRCAMYCCPWITGRSAERLNCQFRGSSPGLSR